MILLQFFVDLGFVQEKIIEPCDTMLLSQNYVPSSLSCHPYMTSSTRSSYNLTPGPVGARGIPGLNGVDGAVGSSGRAGYPGIIPVVSRHG